MHTCFEIYYPLFCCVFTFVLIHALLWVKYFFSNDTGNGASALAPGMSWSKEERRMILHPHLVEEDRDIPGDIRTMREVVNMANSITTMVQFTGDSPSLNKSGKMPLLDLQVLVDNNKLWFEHYRKPMANPLLMMNISAMPDIMKRMALTQEVVRIRRNTHPDLPWSYTVRHLDNFSDRMRCQVTAKTSDFKE